LSVANRKNQIGGGIALVCRNTIDVKQLSHGQNSAFEYGLWKLAFKNITIHVIGIYRPPSLSTYNQFITTFCDYVENTLPDFSNLLIMGDFNFHIEEENSLIRDFNTHVSAMGLQQHVMFETHTAGHSLDLVMTEIENGITVKQCVPGPYISDHCVVKVHLDLLKENIVSQQVTYRNFKRIDTDKFAKDLQNIVVHENSVDSFVQEFENQMQSVLDNNAPLKTKTIICRAPKPWFDNTILDLKRRLQKAEKIWRFHREKANLNFLIPT